MPLLSNFVLDSLEADTLDSVTDRGATTTNAITIGNLTSTGIDDNATSTAITIDSSENVGIGTTSPSTVLDIEGVWVNNQGLLALNATSGVYSGLTMQHSGTAKGYLYYDNASQFLDLYSTNDLRLIGGGSERARITSAGKVGIGTTAPGDYHSLSQFVVAQSGDAGITIASGTSNDGRIFFADGTTGSAESEGTIRYDHSDNSMHFSTTDAVRMSIDNSGNVGIGTSSPTTLLDVRSTTASLGRFESSYSTLARLYLYGGASTTQTDISFFQNNSLSGVMGVNATTGDTFIDSRADGNTIFYRSGTERMRINTSGILCIGTTAPIGSSSNTSTNITLSPSYCWFAHNDAVYIQRPNATAGNVLAFYRASNYCGSVSISSSNTTSFNTSSDERLKENIVDAPAGNIENIRVRSFDWKSNGAHQTYGMVAQELVNVAPEAVTQGNTEDTMWEVDYSKLVPMMIKEIQDLKAEVAALKGA